MISVIIPTFNRPSFLAECLKSITKQTISDFEIIVINDGGNSVHDVVESFKSKIRVVNNPKNLGPPASLNRGIQSSRGEYIALCDDDDLWDEKHLQTLLAAQGGVSQATLFYTDVIAFNAPPQTIHWVS